MAPEDAEDATQEILVKLVTRLESFRGEASFRTCVYRVAVNHLLDFRRSRLEYQNWSFEKHAADLAEGLADPAGDYDPEQAVLAEEVKLGCTLAMVSCLDRPQRIAYILGDVFGVPSQEAAFITGSSPAAYRQRLSRARRKIRDFLSGNCGIADPANACRCGRRVERAITIGRVDPGRLLYAGHPREIQTAVAEMEHLHDVAAVMRSHPRYSAPERVTDTLHRLVGSGNLTLLEEGRKTL